MIKMLTDSTLQFRISNDMREKMGLNDYITVPNIKVHSPVNSYETIPLVYKCDPVTKQWDRSYSRNGMFDHTILSGPIDEFKVVDANGDVTGDLLPGTPVNTLLRDEGGAGDYFRLCRMVVNTTEDYSIIDGKIPGITITEDDGTEYMSFPNPPKGSYLGNSNTVSIGGFSTFASIRIVIPDGLIFSPMLSGRSDARILAELRLPSIDPQCVIQSGFGPAADPIGPLMSGDTSYFGDVIWNSDASKQYLPVTSDNPIYRLNVECRLVYRDPTIEPKILHLGYKDIFEVKLRLLQLQ